MPVFQINVNIVSSFYASRNDDYIQLLHAQFYAADNGKQ